MTTRCGRGYNVDVPNPAASIQRRAPRGTSSRRRYTAVDPHIVVTGIAYNCVEPAKATLLRGNAAAHDLRMFGLPHKIRKVL